MSFSISKQHSLWIEVMLWSDFFTVFITLETKRLATSANQMSVSPRLMWKKTHASTNFMSRLRKKLILSASRKVSRFLWKSNLHYSSLENTIGIYPEPTEPIYFNIILPPTPEVFFRVLTNGTFNLYLSSLSLHSLFCTCSTLIC